MSLEGLAQFVRPLSMRIANLVSRAVVKLVDDSKKLQSVQVLMGEEEARRDIEHFQNYGFSSVPKEGAEAVLLFVGGRRDHGLAIVVDDRRYRIRNLSSGEVAVYDSVGSSIVLKANGNIELNPHSGVVAVVGDVQADGISLKTHVHSVEGSNGSGPVVFVPVGKTGAPS